MVRLMGEDIKLQMWDNPNPRHRRGIKVVCRGAHGFFKMFLVHDASTLHSPTCRDGWVKSGRVERRTPGRIRTWRSSQWACRRGDGGRAGEGGQRGGGGGARGGRSAFAATSSAARGGAGCMERAVMRLVRASQRQGPESSVPPPPGWRRAPRVEAGAARCDAAAQGGDITDCRTG